VTSEQSGPANRKRDGFECFSSIHQTPPSLAAISLGFGLRVPIPAKLRATNHGLRRNGIAITSEVMQALKVRAIAEPL